MVQTTTKKPEHGQNQQAAIASDTSLQSLLRSWEFYALIALAAFLRLYRLDTVVFGVDEGNMFHLARDFFTHGFFPITGNRSSIGSLYPPILIYFLMIPAAFSANPQWADALIGLFNTLGVVITYIFTRRYYGRMAATIASLLFATSSMALIFSNSIWQPNMLPPLNMLFLFCVFRGVVERRKGWLFPALVLFGLLYELHSTTIYMLEVLVPACFFAWRTLRIRDGIFAALVLLVSAVPFIAWEVKSGFADIQIILHAAQTPAHIDWSAYQPYRALLGPYVGSAVERGDMLPSTPTSAFYTTPVRYLLGPLQGLHAILPWLFLCAVLTATGMVLWSRHLSARSESESVAQRSQRGIAGWLRRWLADFRASPLRQGTLLLLIWQIGGLASLIHHSVPLYPHYYTFFLPGQFILLGIFFAQISALLQRYPLRWRAAPRAVVSTAATLLIAAQTLCSGVYLTDMINGNFNAQAVALNFYSMASLQPALDKADQLAQVYHAQRLYIATSFSDESALYALSEQIKTPVTLFDGTHCTLLPSVEAGPVVFLETPYLTGTDQLLHRYATIQQMETVWRPGGDPFKLYLLSAKSTPIPDTQTFTRDLQLLDRHVLAMQDKTSGERWLVTRWQLARGETPAPDTRYYRQFHVTQLAGQPSDATNQCDATQYWQGDQLFSLQKQAKDAPLPSSLTLQAYSYTTVPRLGRLGPLTLHIFDTIDIDRVQLQKADGQQEITLPVQQATSSLASDG